MGHIVALIAAVSGLVLGVAVLISDKETAPERGTPTFLPARLDPPAPSSYPPWYFDDYPDDK